jgi:hypothetical protein
MSVMIVTVSDSPTSLAFAELRMGWNRFKPEIIRSAIFLGTVAMIIVWW